MIFAEDHLQGKEDDSTLKNNSETTVVQVENDLEHKDSDSFEPSPWHEEREPIKPMYRKFQRSTREMRIPI